MRALPRDERSALAPRASSKPLARDGDAYETVSIAYSGGLRYLKLDRVGSTEYRLTKLLTSRT